MSAEPADAGLSTQQTEHFQREGYVILDGFLEREYNHRLIAEVDELMADRANGGKPLLTSYREMGLLTSHPPMMAMIESLMGPRFAMHHIHSSRHDAGQQRRPLASGLRAGAAHQPFARHGARLLLPQRPQR